MQNKSIAELRKMAIDVEEQKKKTIESMEFAKARLEDESLNDEEVETAAKLSEEAVEENEKLSKKATEIQMMISEKIKMREELKGTHNAKSMKAKEGSNNMKSSPEFQDAYVKAIKGDDSQYKKMLSTATTDGTTADAFGALVPTIVENEIEQFMKQYGGLLAHANITTIKGLVQIAVELDTTGAEDHVEGAPAIPDEEITLEEILIKPQMVKKTIKWTDELEMMSAVDLIHYLTNEFLREKLIKIETNMLYAPKNGKGCEGITLYAGTPYVKEVDAAGTIEFTDLLRMLGGTRGENKKFFMNQETFYNQVLAMVDGNGRPIYNQVADKDGKITYLIHGIPVGFLDAMPTFEEATATEHVILLEAQGHYRINFPAGTTPTYILDRVTGATEDSVRLTGKLFAGGRPKKLGGASLLKKGVGA